MKSVVYKYPIPFQENFTLTLPKDSKVVRLDSENGFSFLWALINTEETENYTYHFKSSKTGGVITHDNDLVFVGTYSIFIQMELMLYVFLEKIVNENLKEVSTPIEYVNNCWKG